LIGKEFRQKGFEYCQELLGLNFWNAKGLTRVIISIMLTKQFEKELFH
jgi:hypothetical protein